MMMTTLLSTKHPGTFHRDLPQRHLTEQTNSATNSMNKSYLRRAGSSSYRRWIFRLALLQVYLSITSGRAMRE